jgi:hypothetical protein
MQRLTFWLVLTVCLFLAFTMTPDSNSSKKGKTQTDRGAVTAFAHVYKRGSWTRARARARAANWVVEGRYLIRARAGDELGPFRYVSYCGGASETVETKAQVEEDQAVASAYIGATDKYNIDYDASVSEP